MGNKLSLQAPNVRPSNTEPVVRLNLEAKTPALMEEKNAAVSKIIKG